MNKNERENELRTMEEFLHEFGRGIDPEARLMAGYAESANIQVGADGKRSNAGFWPVPYKPGAYINQNANCYVALSSSVKSPHPKTGVMRYWRGGVGEFSGHGFMVDDVGDGIGSKGEMKINDLSSVLPPSAVIETSPSNYQCVYFFDEPVKDLKRFKAFLTGFVDRVLKKGGDVTIRDTARLFRMPGGINNKRHKDGSLKYPVKNEKTGKDEPWRVRLHSANYQNRYSMDEIAARFGFPIIVPVYREVEFDPQQHTYNTLWLKLAEREMDRLKMGEGSDGSVSMNASGKWRCLCPWGSEHANGDPSGAFFRGPIEGAEVEFVFSCSHDGCKKARKRGWYEFIDEIVIRKMERELDKAARVYLK